MPTAHEARVEKEGRLAEGDEVLKEALCRVGEEGIGADVEGTAEADLVAGEQLDGKHLCQGGEY